MSFKAPVAGAGKHKSATTDVKFQTKTPVNKELDYSGAPRAREARAWAEPHC